MRGGGQSGEREHPPGAAGKAGTATMARAAVLRYAGRQTAPSCKASPKMLLFTLPILLPLALVGWFLAPAHALEASGGSRPAVTWPDTPAARSSAQNLVAALNADLLANTSATATLERWCAQHGIAEPAIVRAARVREAEGPAPEEARALLAVGPGTPVRHRRVRLACGAVVLSEADNYYLPERLTPEMNALLDDTDTPFGKVVRSLDFRRRTLEARLLWTPAEAGAGAPDGAGASLPIPPFVLAHRAVLTLPDGTPFSALIERYTSGVLAFPPPP